HWVAYAERTENRKQMRAGTRDETRAKQDMRIGGPGQHYTGAMYQRKAWVPEDLGLIVVSCERGDIRHSKYGIAVYDDEGIHDLELEPEGAGVRRGELEELYNAIVNNAPAYHDGRWGMATLEVCLAIMQSAKEHREIDL